MQSIDVLCHDRDNFPGAFERDHRLVQRVWLRALIDLPRFQFVVPVLDARGFRSEELVVVHRTTAAPYSARPAKIGDTAGGGNASTGQDEDAPRFTEPFDEARVDHLVYGVMRSSLRRRRPSGCCPAVL